MIETDFITEWKKTDFSSYNETDVRENFIAPLLKILGYGKNTINDILTEKTLKLQKPLQRLGRKRVTIDYIPTIRLKSFWIIEAKPGNTDLKIGDFLQAYFYATHPEVQVQYIVLCNGKQLDIYDIYYSEEWNKPFFSINQNECESKFKELIEILSADKMLATIRKRIVSQIRDAFEVELDMDQFLSFKMEASKTMSDIEKVIKENEKNAKNKVMKEQEERYRNYLNNADSKELISSMKWADRRNASLYMAYYKLIERAGPVERAELLKKLRQVYYGRIMGEFKVDCLGIYLRVVENNLDVANSIGERSVEEDLRDLIVGNLTYHKHSDFQNALAFLDRICHKFAYRMIRNESLMKNFTQQIADKKAHMSKDEEICKNLSVTTEMSRLINAFLNILWSALCMEDSFDKIWRHVMILEQLCSKASPLPKYPDDNEDFLWYEAFGDDFDYLCRCSCLFITGKEDMLRKIGVEEQLVSALQNCDTKDYSLIIPKLPEIKREVTSSDMSDTMAKVMYALAKAVELYDEVTKDQ